MTAFINGEATKTPSNQELAWAAGFIEGDGHFAKHKTTVEIDVTQKELEPLQWMQSWFGGSIFEVHKQGIKKLSYFRWRIAGEKARCIMRTLYPMMTSKRKRQIDNCLGTKHD